MKRVQVGPMAFRWGRRDKGIKRWGRKAGRKAGEAVRQVRENPRGLKRTISITGKVLPWAALAGVAAVVVHDELKARRDAAVDYDLPPTRARSGDRGRQAHRPGQIPKAGWKDILWRTFQQVGEDDVISVARSIAFSGMLALFPALAAFVSIYGLFADAAAAREHLAILAGVVPTEALTLIGDQIVRLASANGAGLSFTAVVGILLSLWSANAGMKSLFRGLNIAFEEEEKRSFLVLNLVTLAFTVGMILFFAVAVAGVIALPIALQFVGADSILPVLSLLRWPALLVLLMVGLAVLYRYGPSRSRARWRWVSYGAVGAAVLWVGASLLFSWYLTNFANYEATYGSLGAVFGFLIWLWLSSMVVLMGAELNSEIEHQTARDSTTGAPLPRGERGAVMADQVGRPAPKRLLPSKAERMLHKMKSRGSGDS